MRVERVDCFLAGVSAGRARPSACFCKRADVSLLASVEGTMMLLVLMFSLSF